MENLQMEKKGVIWEELEALNKTLDALHQNLDVLSSRLNPVSIQKSTEVVATLKTVDIPCEVAQRIKVYEEKCAEAVARVTKMIEELQV